jgi:hypothetical protein
MVIMLNGLILKGFLPLVDNFALEIANMLNRSKNGILF